MGPSAHAWQERDIGAALKRWRRSAAATHYSYITLFNTESNHGDML
jgi:hypothetical protein